MKPLSQSSYGPHVCSTERGLCKAPIQKGLHKASLSELCKALIDSRLHTHIHTLMHIPVFSTDMRVFHKAPIYIRLHETPGGFVHIDEAL